jgi:hypothetical protein
MHAEEQLRKRRVGCGAVSRSIYWTLKHGLKGRVSVPLTYFDFGAVNSVILTSYYGTACMQLMNKTNKQSYYGSCSIRHKRTEPRAKMYSTLTYLFLWKQNVLRLGGMYHNTKSWFD